MIYLGIFLEITLLIAVVVTIVLLVRLQRKKNDNEMIMRMENQMLQFQKELSENLGNNKQELERTKDIISQNTIKTMEMIKQLGSTVEQLTEEQKHATKLSEDLKYIFQRPKSRGNYTEIMLEDMLDRVLPKGIWEKQYMLNDASQERVDFAIKYNKRIVPVDVKFPIEDYNRYLNETDDTQRREYWKSFMKVIKNMLQDISKKYVHPELGTSEFAIMFIPSDTVYFDAVSQSSPEGLKNDIFEYAQEQKVLLAGPSTFYAFLQIVISGLRNIEIYKNTQNIIDNIKRLEKNLSDFFKKYEEVGKHIEKAKSAYDTGETHYERIKKRSTEIISMENDVKQIDKE